MATSKEPDKFIDIIKCPICLEKYTIHKYLPCLHTFCENCILTYTSKTFEEENKRAINCPICRSEVVLQEENVDIDVWAKSLPQNCLIVGLIKRDELESLNKKCMICARIDIQSDAQFVCLECSDTLCASCGKAHKANKASSKHTLNPIEDACISELQTSYLFKNICNTHANKELELFCVDHEEPCCSTCVSIHHRRCEKVLSIDDAAKVFASESKVQQLQKELADVETDIDRLLADRNGSNQELINQYDIGKKQLETMFDDLIVKVNEFKTQRESELHKAFDQLSDKIDTLVTIFMCLKKNVENEKGILDASANKASPAQLMIEMQRVRKMLTAHEKRLQDIIPDIRDATLSVKTTDSLELNKLLNQISEVKIAAPSKPEKQSRLRSIAYGQTTLGYGPSGEDIEGGNLTKRNSLKKKIPERHRSQKAKSLTSMPQEVKLHKAEVPWKPFRKMTKEYKTEELFKKVRGILNKLTSKNFETLVKKMSDLEITCEEHIKGAAILVYEKAVAEKDFTSVYASLCRYLTSIKVPSESKPGEFVNFRGILLTRCQREFEQDKKADDEIEKMKRTLKEAAVPHANVIASMEDYERDMGAEKKRVQDMLEEIYKEETEKEKEKERKEAEEKAKTLQTSTVKPTVSTGVSVPSLAVSSGTSFTLPTTSVPTSATSAQTTASSVTFNFATVKSLSPSKTPVTTSAPPASLTTGGTTATVTSSGFMVSSKPQTTVAPLSSGAPTLGGFNTGGKSQTPASSAPGLGNPNSLSGTSSSVSGTAPLNFGTNSTATTTVSSLAPSSFSFGTSNTATTSASSAPNFNFGVKPTTQSSGISSQPSTASGVTFSFNSQQAPTTSTQLSTLTFGTQQQNYNPAGQQGTPSFAFGQTAATSSSTQSNPSASTFGFKPFGQTSQNSQSTTTSSIFGAQPSTGMPSFGNSQSTNTATSGSPAGQGSSMPAFGHGATSTTPAFGQGSTTAPPPYGQGSTSATPAFGQGSTSSTPSFGQGSASAPTAFGQGSTSATPAFGQGSAPGPSFGQGPTSATPAFGQGSAPGPSFGQGSTSTPFGQATATTMASTAGGFNFSTGGSSFGSTAAPNANPFAPSGSFGASTTKSGFPSFGASTTTTASSRYAFGGTSSTAASGSSFGQPSATPSAGFGGSSFGATSGTTNTGFGSFGTNAPKTTTSGFGSFGQTSSTVKTEASSTTGAFAFGGATPTKPSINTGFNFSATSAAPSTPSNQTGFNFSASAATPANNAPGGFNFSANASFGTPTGIPTPSFGTPSAGGTPNMFSMGAPNSAPTKPRVALRGRRRPGGRGR